jgi:hypothetical protein
MADTKISAMAAATSLNTAKFPVVESGTNKTGEISSDTTLADNSDAKVPTQKAVKAYADTKAGLSHGHAIGDITNLQTALDGKAAALGSDDNYVTDAEKVKLSNLSGTNTGDQDLSGYALTSHNHAGVYQPADTQLTSLAGLSYAGNAQKVVRVNAGETDFELATLAGGGDVVGNDTSVSVQNIVAYAHVGGKQITELTGTAGDMLIYDGGLSSWVKLAKGAIGQVLQMDSSAASPAWTYGGLIHSSKSTGVTTTGANTTPVSVSGAVFTYAANAVYKIWVMGRLNSAAATTGMGLQFDLSSAVTAIDVQFYHTLAATGTLSGGNSIADDASAGVSSGVPAGPLDVPVTGEGLLVTGANTGTCQLRLRSETTAVTELLAGTVMCVWRVA